MIEIDIPGFGMVQLEHLVRNLAYILNKKLPRLLSYTPRYAKGNEI